jgi:hypothetical protein
MDFKRFKRSDLVHIEWLDSASTDMWENVDANIEPAKCDTVGYIVKYTEATVAITHSYSHYGHRMQCLAIPRGTVVDMALLSKTLRLPDFD